MFKFLVVISLFYSPYLISEESLDESVRKFACSMNSLSMGMSESASGGSLDCTEVRPSSGGNINMQQAPGFGRWLKLQFCTLIGGCVRKMSLSNNENSFMGEDCIDFTSLPINLSNSVQGDKESCMWSIYYDIWYAEKEGEKVSSLMNCNKIICDQQVMNELKEYLKQNNINKFNNPEEYFGCTISI